MLEIDISQLIKKANKEFKLENFDNSLILYGSILNDTPDNKSAIMGIYLSEIGLKNSLKANVLFDYFVFLKDEVEDFDTLVDNFIQLLEFEDENIVEPVDHLEKFISFQDFLMLIHNTDDVKETITNIIFSTKIVLRSQEEYILFIQTLVSIGQTKMAIKFLNSLIEENDWILNQEIFNLYIKLKNL